VWASNALLVLFASGAFAFSVEIVHLAPRTRMKITPYGLKEMLLKRRGMGLAAKSCIEKAVKRRHNMTK
jgi:hypothetical protein